MCVCNLSHQYQSSCNIFFSDDINNMPYTTMCIKEGLRMYPPASGVGRQLTKPLLLEGVELLPGTVVFIDLMTLHHNASVWGEDHMVYDPERFSSQNIKKIDSFAYCPFSAGPR